MFQKPVGGEADGFAPRRRQVGRNGHAGEGDGISTDGPPEEEGLGRWRVDGPGIVHGR